MTTININGTPKTTPTSATAVVKPPPHLALQPLPSAATRRSAKPLDIIWTTTKVCPHDCANCAASAIHVARRNREIILTQPNAEAEAIPLNPGQSIFDQALEHRQRQGLELTYQEKLRILDHLVGVPTRLDITGGDALIVTENMALLSQAAARIGRENITLTATGAGLHRVNPAEVAGLISELNFTYDSAALRNPHRPGAYATANLAKAAEFAALGVKTRAECPLSAHNIALDHLTRLYTDLHEAGIDKLLIMRLFPSGRGAATAKDIPTPAQYRAAVAHLRSLEAHLGSPALKLQCAMRFWDAPQNQRENPCDLLRESLGLMADGTLLTSAWALDGQGRPLDDAFVLGNLAKTPITQLLASEKAQRQLARLDENFGNCKIFSFFHSTKASPEDRLFDTADPLLTTAVAAIVPATATAGKDSTDFFLPPQPFGNFGVTQVRPTKPADLVAVA